MGAIAVSAYSYMALVPVIQPPIMRALTTKHERLIRMKPPRIVSHTEKVIFPIVGLLLTCFLVPSGLPLLGMLFFGNLLKESGVTRRLANTASGPLIDVITILLGLTVGASTQASHLGFYLDLYPRCILFHHRNSVRCHVCQILQSILEERQ